jgi:hypothetical protein
MTIKKRASARTKSSLNQSDLSEPDSAPIELALLDIGRGEVLLQKYVQSELAVPCDGGGVGEDEKPLDYSFRRLEPGEAVYTGGTGQSYDFAFVVSRDEIRGNKVVTFVSEERGIHKPEDSIGEALSWVASGLRLARNRAPSNDQVLCILNLLLNAPDVGPDTWIKTKDAKLRLDLAGNPLMPASALEQLAKQKSAAVRSAIAENPAAPTELRQRLLQDLVDTTKPSIRVAQCCTRKNEN